MIDSRAIHLSAGNVTDTAFTLTLPTCEDRRLRFVTGAAVSAAPGSDIAGYAGA